MNTAADIFSYAQTHDINLIADDGQLKIDAPETALTDEFLQLAKAHKVEILQTLSQRELIEAACRGLEITPTQFRTICSKEDLEYIANGSIPMEEIRAYATSFAEGISTGRIVVHPKTQELIRHITACQWSAEQENNTR